MFYKPAGDIGGGGGWGMARLTLNRLGHTQCFLLGGLGGGGEKCMVCRFVEMFKILDGPLHISGISWKLLSCLLLEGN